MGLRHDNFVDLTANTTVTPEAGGAAVAIQYAHGYIDLTNRFRTVMSYNEQCIAGGFNCTRIPHFSNPSVSFNNVSGYASAVLATTGNVSNAHERQALNDTRDTTANFRTALASLTGPGAISFVLPAYSIVESAGTIQIPVARHVGSTGSVSISYASASGSATSGSDFTGVSGTLSWADGDTTTKFISVSILQDAVLEGPETFSIALSSPTGGATIGSGLIATTVTIRDDELDNFPAACAIGPGWTTPPGATTGWIVASDDYYGATCSLKSNVMANATVGAVNKAQIQFAGNFVAGNITFARRVSSESGWDCFRFLVDGVTQGVGGSCAGIGGTGASGELGWGVVSIPVTAGFHTLVWSYEKDDSATGGSDAAWIDSVVLPLAPTIAKQSDFNGDGKSDMVYRNDQTGQVYIVGRNGLAAGPVSGFAVTVPNLSWKIVGMADFNGDGKADILYRHDTTGQVFVYLMDGTSIIGSGFVLTEANLAWKIIAAADFNGDGKADILYRNDVTGQVYVYFMNGTVLAGGGGFIVTVPNLSWKIVGVGDFNGDGKADLLYWNDTTGQVYVYFVNGATTIGGGFVLTESNLNWKIISVADFNGDGKADILYRHDVTGQVYVYFGNGATTNGGGFIVTAPNLSWKVVATGDYNGDGKADLLYRNDVTGEVFIYLVNGSTTTSGGFVYTEPNLAWKVLN